MNGLSRLMRDALTVARRDFVATVATPTFLLFLLAPLFMLGFGAIGGLGAATVGKGAEEKQRIYAILNDADSAAIEQADKDARVLFQRKDQVPLLILVRPEADAVAQARGLLLQSDRDVPAVLYGSLAAPQIIHRNATSSTSRYLGYLAERTLRDRRAGIEGPVSKPRFERIAPKSGSIGGRNAAAFLGVFGLFLLSLMLAGQAVGTMAEERSNKVIEVLAAAVPLESVFLGKLIGMLGVAVLFIGFWGTIAGGFGLLIPTGALPPEAASALGDIRPAVGLPLYALLFLVYFLLAYLLLGSVFLGVGALASTQRELQMLSLPITVVQVGMFGLSASAAGAPDSMVAKIAEVFPFSSPFAMIARAANDPAIWPHLAAIAWQLLWVSICIGLGARLFRRGVLQSSGPKLRLFRKGSAAA
ncbi:ABC transporter permease [Sphingomonas sp. FW199]|uniref:ABC transporter permease n=1 Tax=Sphingomonas sp. FW199 TaxID=3400217 RepID=UPI003CED45F3